MWQSSSRVRPVWGEATCDGCLDVLFPGRVHMSAQSSNLGGISMTRTLRRMSGVILAVSLAFTMLTLTAPPSAQAAGTCTTKVQIWKNGNWRSPNATKFKWGKSTALRASATCSDGRSGWVPLQRSTDGGKTWYGMGSEGYWSGNLKMRTAKYRAMFRESGTTVDVDVMKVKMKRKVNANQINDSNRAKFKIKPPKSIKWKKVTFQRKKNGKWVFYKKVQVNKYGVVKTWFHSSRQGIKYRMVMPWARGFIKSKYYFTWTRS